MGLNYNTQETGKTNMNEVHNNHNAIAPSQIGILPEKQEDNSSLTGHSKSSSSVTQDKGYCRKSLVTLISFPLKKYSIHPRYKTEPYGSKLQYRVSDNPNTQRSHGEEKIKIY